MYSTQFLSNREINPHIPQYIMQAPWYYQATQATLKHQRIQEDKLKNYDDRNTWYKKGLREVRLNARKHSFLQTSLNSECEDLHFCLILTSSFIISSQSSLIMMKFHIRCGIIIVRGLPLLRNFFPHKRVTK